MEKMDDKNWENIPSPIEYEKELRRIRRNLRKRSALLVLTSLVLAAALLFAAVRYAVPALESLYWDPRTVSYGTEAGTDLDMVLAAYTDLFCPTTYFEGTLVGHTGFASYSISVMTLDETTNEKQVSYGSLEKGELFIPYGVWDTVPHTHVGDYWIQANQYDPKIIEINRKFTIEILSPLPEYIQVAAYITFTEDKTLTETFRFRDELANAKHDPYNDTGYLWTAIRHTDKVDNSARCGFSYSSLTNQFPEANEVYPAFSEWQAYEDRNICYEQWSTKEQTYTAHFKSLLKFMDDQLKNGTGFPAPAIGEVDMEYYANALDYVEENGVMAYGCYIIASPQHLLEIMEREDVLYVQLDGGWLYI